MGGLFLLRKTFETGGFHDRIADEFRRFQKRLKAQGQPASTDARANAQVSLKSRVFGNPR